MVGPQRSHALSGLVKLAETREGTGAGLGEILQGSVTGVGERRRVAAAVGGTEEGDGGDAEGCRHVHRPCIGGDYQFRVLAQ